MVFIFCYYFWVLSLCFFVPGENSQGNIFHAILRNKNSTNQCFLIVRCPLPSYTMFYIHTCLVDTQKLFISIVGGHDRYFCAGTAMCRFIIVYDPVLVGNEFCS